MYRVYVFSDVLYSGNDAHQARKIYAWAMRQFGYAVIVRG